MKKLLIVLLFIAIPSLSYSVIEEMPMEHAVPKQSSVPKAPWLRIPYPSPAQTSVASAHQAWAAQVLNTLARVITNLAAKN